MDTESSGSRGVILYARVSTQEQAEHGYSLAQQLEVLREHARREGFVVLEEVADEGYSGKDLERPGLDRVRDLVEKGGVSVVMAQDRDRFAREPAYVYVLREGMAKYGCALRALNDRGDDSPEGELTDGILDQIAKYERLKIIERTRRGSLQKARSGRVLLNRRINFGFRANATRDNFDVDEEKMPTARRIFKLINDTGSVNRTINTLNSEGIPSPGGKAWSHTTVRDIILDDVYRPHTHEEVAAMVTPEVSLRLDPEKSYGIWYYNRRKVTRGREPKTYRRTTKTVFRDKGEWIAVPVPDAGLDRQVVDSARRVIENNVKCSNAGRRVWELSGGILKCGACGRAMSSRTISRGNAHNTLYYVCGSYRKKPPTCNHVKHHRAEEVEKTVVSMVEELLADPDRLVAHVEEKIAGLRARLTQEALDGEVKQVSSRIEKIDRMKKLYRRQAAEELMTFEDLGIALSELEQERVNLNVRLEEIRDREEHLEELEREKSTLMKIVADRISAGLEGLTPKQRQDIYRRLGLTVSVKPGGEVELDGRFEANYLPDPESVRYEDGNVNFFVPVLSSVNNGSV